MTPRHTLALAALMTLAQSPAQAATYNFQQGAAGYGGAADTMLRATDPDTTHGAEVEIGVDASDGGLPTQALLRFDGLFGNGPGQIAFTSQITSATLTLNITSAGSGIRFHDMLQSWNAATITWNSAAGGIQADGNEAAVLPFLQIGSNDGGTHIGSGPLVLDLTDALQRMQAGAVPGFGWALLPFMPDGTNGVDFYSAEWVTLAERPLLSVQALPVPEPGSALLLAAGMLGLAARRLRQR